MPDRMIKLIKHRICLMILSLVAPLPGAWAAELLVEFQELNDIGRFETVAKPFTSIKAIKISPQPDGYGELEVQIIGPSEEGVFFASIYGEKVMVPWKFDFNIPTNFGLDADFSALRSAAVKEIFCLQDALHMGFLEYIGFQGHSLRIYPDIARAGVRDSEGEYKFLQTKRSSFSPETWRQARMAERRGNRGPICAQLHQNIFQDPKSWTEQMKSTLLSRSILRGDTVLALEIIQEGELSVVNVKDPEGYTPLIRALRAANNEVARALLKLEGVDLHATDKWGHTAIKYSGYKEVQTE